MHFCCSKPKNYVEKAKTKQKVSATYRRVENLSRQMSRAVTTDLVNGIVSFKRKIKKKTLLDAYEIGDYNGMLEAVPWSEFEDHFEHFDRSLKTAAVKSGNLTIPTIPAPDNAKIRFDIKNPNLDRYVKRRTGNLIVDIKQQSLDHVRATIERSFNEALTPDRIADEIRSSIGLLLFFCASLNP